MPKKSVDRSSVRTLLGTMHMNEGARSRARANLHSGEVIAETMLRAAADMHSIAQGVRHVATGMARGIRALFAKPVKY
jgi:hypothetical protein